MKNVVVVIDTKNIMFCLGKAFKTSKLDYSKYMLKAKSESDILLRGIAYITQEPDFAQSFAFMISHFGLDAKYKPPVTRGQGESEVRVRTIGVEVMMAIDVMLLINTGKVDKLVIGSSDSSLVDLIDAAKKVGVHTTVFACGIPHEMRNAADTAIEITEDMLYIPKK